MGAFTYTGNGSTQNITTPFYPDMAWVKGRNSTYYHRLTSTGLTQPNYLAPNATDAEGSTNDTISALASKYFQVNAAGTGGTNQSGSTYVGWAWNANNGTTVSNTSGSTTSTVSANTTAGFSVVTYTGTGANATVGHGLGVAPAMIIVKRRSSSALWAVWNKNLTSGTYYLVLNTTAAQANGGTSYWNTGAVTSTTFQLGNDGDVNGSTATYVAYCWAEVAGYSSIGSYTGNGSTDGPFVYTSFRPAFVLIRCSSAAQGWYLYDSTRGTYNVVGPLLEAQSTAAESTASQLDFLSNGFKIRESGAGSNTSSATYIYMAFAENPFKYANAR
jgi:hypothetical protein